MTAAEIGRLGETTAADAYKNNGFEILCTNYRTRFGEIDIIAIKQNQLVFAEVKTRSAGAKALPREWVNHSKQQKIILAAKEYIARNSLDDCFMRFDVVEVLVNKNTVLAFNIIEDAFSLT